MIDSLHSGMTWAQVFTILSQVIAAVNQIQQAVGNGNPVKAPLPGTITNVNVKVGDNVNVGDVVIVLEAMKMQNNIEAEYAGTVTAINVNPGDSVMEGSVLLTIG